MRGALALFLCLCVHLSGCTRSNRDEVVVLSGDARGIGTEMGTRFRSEIRDLVGRWLEPKLNAVPLLINLFAQVKTGNMSFPGPIREEVEAIAGAAGLDESDIYTASAAPDLMTLAGTPFGCSSFAVMPDRSKTGAMLVGHNLDFPDSELLREHWVALLFAKEGAYRILSIQLPGLVGLLNAINEKGVLIMVHMVDGQDTDSRNMPVLVNARLVLEKASTAREALDLYVRNSATVPMNMLFADGKEAYVVEASASRSATRGPTREGRTLYVANHFASPTMASSGPQADDRWPILRRHDGSGAPLGMDEVVQVVGDAGGFNATGDSNILAVFVDYANHRISWGADSPRPAFGSLNEIDFKEVFEGSAK